MTSPHEWQCVLTITHENGPADVVCLDFESTNVDEQGLTCLHFTPRGLYASIAFALPCTFTINIRLRTRLLLSFTERAALSATTHVTNLERTSDLYVHVTPERRRVRAVEWRVCTARLDQYINS